MNKGILKRMIHVFRMNSYVRLVRHLNEIADYNTEDKGKTEKDKIGIYHKTRFKFTRRPPEYIVNEFFMNSKTWFIIPNDIVIARKTCQQAIDNEFIKRNDDKTLFLVKDGHDFASWPLGLLQALLTKFGLGIALITSGAVLGIVATLSSVIWQLIKWVTPLK